jgi:hypothetical protein
MMANCDETLFERTSQALDALGVTWRWLKAGQPRTHTDHSQRNDQPREDKKSGMVARVGLEPTTSAL